MSDKKEFKDYIKERSKLLQCAYNSRCLMRDIKSGLETYEQKTKYIKKLSHLEPQETYDNRIYNSVFHNITNRMIKINYTRPFGKVSQLSSSDDYLKNLQNNFDSYNNSLTDFGKKVFKTAMYDSMAHIFVDLPENPDNEFKPDLLPRAILLNNDDILGARVGNGGEIMHLRFRIMKEIPHPENPFDVVLSPIYYVFDKKEDGSVYYNIYREFENEVVSFFDESKKYILNKIPLVSYYPDDCEIPFYPDIIFKDLANKNIEYFRSASDQTNILHIARVPILFFKGIDENKNGLGIGVGMAVNAGDSEYADGKYIEINGGSINAGRTNMNDILTQMESLGLELMSKNTTATSSIIDNAQNTSLLTAFAVKLQSTLINVVKLMIELKEKTGYTFKTKEFNLNIDTKFSIVVDQAELQFMQFLRSSGDISGKTITNYAKSLGYLQADYNFENDMEENLSANIVSNDFLNLINENNLKNKNEADKKDEKDQDDEI